MAMGYFTFASVLLSVVLAVARTSEDTPPNEGDQPALWKQMASVTFINACVGAEQTYNFIQNDPQCVNTNLRLPVVDVKTAPSNIILTLYKEDSCSGDSFQYSNKGCDRMSGKRSVNLPPFLPASFSVSFNHQ